MCLKAMDKKKTLTITEFCQCFLFVYLYPHRLHKIKFAENKIILQIQSAFDILSTDNSKTLLYNRWMDG